MKIKLTLFLLFFALAAFSQQLTLRGHLKAAGSGYALPNGNLTLAGGKDTLRSNSTAEGAIQFENVKPGKYRLIATYLGFSPDTQTLRLTKDTTVLVLLKNDKRQLSEVVIRSNITPATVRHDTLIFNSRAYPSSPNVPVEELLRKLPGIQIDRDGNITIQGKQVDKVLIDGKTFFIDDLRKATRNLPADIVAQVEVYASQSEESKQAGITENSATKTIDLKLKKDKKVGWLGKLYAGYGNGDHYAAGGTATHLDEKSLFSADVKFNNINDQFTGIERNQGGGTAGQQRAGELNLNYKQDVNKKLTFEAYGSGNFNRLNEASSDFRQTYLPDSTLHSGQTASHSGSANSLHAGLKLTYKADEQTYFNQVLSYGPGNSQNNTQNTTLLQVQKGDVLDTASTGRTLNGGRNSAGTFSDKLSVTHRFAKPGRALEVSLGTVLGSQRQSEDIFTRVLSKNPSDTALVNQRSANQLRNNSYRAVLLYSEPMDDKHSLRLQYSSSLADSRSFKQSDNFDALNGLYDLPDTLTSNHFENKVSTQQLGLSFSNRPQSKLYYELGIGAQSAMQENHNLNSGAMIRRDDQNVLPVASLGYNPGNGKNLSVRYFGYGQSPTIEQLQPLPDLSNPYLVKMGNPYLRQSFMHSLEAGYIGINSENYHALQVSLRGDLTEHPISGASTTLAGGIQQVQFLNLDPVHHLSADVVYGVPLIGLDNAICNFGTHVIFGRDRSRTGGLDNVDASQGAGGKFDFFYHVGNKFIADGKTSLTFLENRYSLPGQTNARSWQNDYMLNVSWLLPLSLTAAAYYNLQLRSTTGLPDQQSSLLNASLAKDLFGGHNAQLRLSGFNLLDTKSAISQFSGPGFIENRQSNTLQRLTLLSFVYNFQKFGKDE